MKCTKCGCEFSEGLFCPECGTKYNEEEAKIQQERLTKEREVELAQAKVEQERLAKERVEQEAELLRQKNESIRIEQEIAAKKAEELSRTFNGQIFASIEEMQIAKSSFEKAEREKKQIKKANNMALWCMILGIATLPLTMTIVLWFPSIILSVVFGVSALKGKTEKKGFAITGFILDALFVLIIIIGVVFM